MKSTVWKRTHKLTNGSKLVSLSIMNELPTITIT